VSRDQNGPRKFSLELTTSGVVSIAIVALLGMCWAFILGILLGRGYKPETAVPPLANIMPTTEARLPDEATGSPPKALKPEDLTFMDNIQDKGKDGDVVADSTQKGPSEPKKMPGSQLKSRDLPDTRAVAGQVPTAPAVPSAKAQPTGQAAKTTAAPPTKAQAKVDPKTPFDKASGGKYRATYQVASFPARDKADAMVKRLAGKGLSATIHEAKSNNRTVFRVNIQLRGTDAEINDTLRKSGEKGPILLDKKPL